ncbi:katanin p80 WD40 repeat-containing subunit B1-like isoform X2 [Mizuhopecten yessoensis]|uniref:katanin p80 WD40 repeat-containing subunit B1-like isoform X2 n=1 Tax=Mizuhopecten yessoensis TaxID=6573 RepID=UPI000B45ECFA|nr:katanin p80 WD40 repeat-containing subunit B1-like isoform X2 [Mizuhopecten yessoensis]
MSHTKRAWKLQEFVAHAANVNCLAIGHKSGRVMVTGGEDRKVNLWAVGKPNCIMSLTGHTTPVEAVRFGHEEEIVVAGSVSGALKIWNLEEAKIMRTLTGHNASIRSLDFHPFGDYAASGSMDCNIKLWDIRRKGCIYTYKGHTSSVNCVRFSPDGKWIASASDDGLVKMWDITAGRMLTELTEHTGPVNVVEFHPNELLIASGSSDRTVKFWDLETFKMVSTTDGDSSPVRRIFFHPEGQCMFSGGRDVMKVYGWEPAKCYDSIPMSWGEVADIGLAQNQLICAAFSKTNVSSFVVDLQRVKPCGTVPHSDGPPSPSVGVAPHNMSNSSGRRSFITERPPTTSTRQASVPKEEAEEPTHDKDDMSDESAADIQSPAVYNNIFRPKSKLSRSPTRQSPFMPPPEDGQSEIFPVHQPASTPAPVTQRTKSVTKTASKPSVPPVSKTPSATPVVKAVSNPTPKPNSTPAPPPKEPDPIAGIAAEDFLPKSAYGGSTPSGEPNEEEVLSAVLKGHGAMAQVMSGRSKNIQIVRAMWTSGNTKTAVDSAISMNDQAVLVDLLNVLNLKSGLWSLELCATLLPLVKDLLQSKYDSYVMTACNALKIILRNFGPVIKSNLTAPPSVGVDISREERYRKCNKAYSVILQIRSDMDKRQNLQGNVGTIFRELQILMNNLE